MADRRCSAALFVYLSGGECGWAAVSSVILAVGPVVDGVTPAIPSKRLDTRYKRETSVNVLPTTIILPHTVWKAEEAKKRKLI